MYKTTSRTNLIQQLQKQNPQKQILHCCAVLSAVKKKTKYLFTCIKNDKRNENEFAVKNTNAWCVCVEISCDIQMCKDGNYTCVDIRKTVTSTLISAEPKKCDKHWMILHYCNQLFFKPRCMHVSENIQFLKEKISPKARKWRCLRGDNRSLEASMMRANWGWLECANMFFIVFNRMRGEWNEDFVYLYAFSVLLVCFPFWFASPKETFASFESKFSELP